MTKRPLPIFPLIAVACGLLASGCGGSISGAEPGAKKSLRKLGFEPCQVVHRSEWDGELTAVCKRGGCSVTLRSDGYDAWSFVRELCEDLDD